MYKERYEEFQSTINRSNDMFQKFKTEMEKVGLWTWYKIKTITFNTKVLKQTPYFSLDYLKQKLYGDKIWIENTSNVYSKTFPLTIHFFYEYQIISSEEKLYLPKKFGWLCICLIF